MPCDAIAVAKGQISLDLARELDGLGPEAVAQTLLALLRQCFAHLGQPELTSLWSAHSGARASGIGVRIGNVLIRVSPDWRVTVNIRRRSPCNDTRRQWEYLSEVHALGGLAFYLIYAEKLDRVFGADALSG